MIFITSLFRRLEPPAILSKDNIHWNTKSLPLIALEGWCKVSPLFDYFPNFFLNAAFSAGTITNKSPTTPYRATLNIGASASLLMATTIFALRIPARC